MKWGQRWGGRWRCRGRWERDHRKWWGGGCGGEADTGLLSSADAFPGSEPRVLGLAMVPGHHIVSIEVERDAAAALCS